MEWIGEAGNGIAGTTGRGPARIGMGSLGKAPQARKGVWFGADWRGIAGWHGKVCIG
jgi:hypothetical protein